MLGMWRRAILGLGIAGATFILLRLRGGGGVAPQNGGWRQLSPPEYR